MDSPELLSAGFPKDETEQTIGDRFDKIVAPQPDRVAIRDAGKEITYAELGSSVDRLAYEILDRIGPHPEPVVLLLPHGPDQLKAIFAVLKANKFYMPLDAGDPPVRLRDLMADSTANLILVNNETLPLAIQLKSEFPNLVILNLDSTNSASPEKRINLDCSPEALGVVIYTSGSTGKPKGVAQNHRNLLRIARGYTNSLGVFPDDRLMYVPPYNFASSFFQTFCGLLNGASLAIFNFGQRGFDELANWIQREQITIFRVGSPTLFRHFTDSLDRTTCFTSVRRIVLGGEPIYRSDLERVRNHFPPDCRVFFSLAATETGLLAGELIDPAAVTEELVPVGPPFPELEISLRDDQGSEVDTGETGEIFVKSRYLSPGYWHQPELTQSVFSEAPEGGGMRVYKTGDLARLRADGRIVHLGRKDFQVKVQGFTVQVAEIENLLRAQGEVKDAVVTAFDGLGAKRLAAYVVMRPKINLPAFELRKRLSERLPPYMVPSAWVYLAELPRNPSGKVDRNALPPPMATRPELQSEFLAPRDEIELQLAQIWELLIGVEPIGVHDDFFELGGDSIIGARIFTELARTFDRKLPLALLIQAPTIEQLAEKIKSESLEIELGSSLLAFQPEGHRRPFFLVSGGEGNDVVMIRYMKLTPYLGKDQPFYGLKARGANGEYDPHTSVGIMAADYVQEIKKVQPGGPYLIGGSCVGGIVALEMAQQLTAAGEQVQLLLMIDTIRDSRFFPYARLSYTRNEARQRLVQLRWTTSSEARRLYSILRLRRDELARYALGAARRFLQSFTENGRLMKGQIRLRSRPRYGQTIGRYRATPYPGRITLLVNSEYHQRKPTLGWDGIAAGGLDIHKIEGDHNHLLTHTQSTGEAIRACLEQAQAQ